MNTRIGLEKRRKSSRDTRYQIPNTKYQPPNSNAATSQQCSKRDSEIELSLHANQANIIPTPGTVVHNVDALTWAVLHPAVDEPPAIRAFHDRCGAERHSESRVSELALQNSVAPRQMPAAHVTKWRVLPGRRTAEAPGERAATATCAHRGDASNEQNEQNE